jgi:hypothetical protein
LYNSFILLILIVIHCSILSCHTFKNYHRVLWQTIYVFCSDNSCILLKPWIFMVSYITSNKHFARLLPCPPFSSCCHFSSVLVLFPYITSSHLSCREFASHLTWISSRQHTLHRNGSEEATCILDFRLRGSKPCHIPSALTIIRRSSPEKTLDRYRLRDWSTAACERCPRAICVPSLILKYQGVLQGCRMVRREARRALVFISLTSLILPNSPLHHLTTS